MAEYVLKFTKTGYSKYISHLDLIRKPGGKIIWAMNGRRRSDTGQYTVRDVRTVPITS